MKVVNSIAGNETKKEIDENIWTHEVRFSFDFTSKLLLNVIFDDSQNFHNCISNDTVTF